MFKERTATEKNIFKILVINIGDNCLGIGACSVPAYGSKKDEEKDKIS